MAQQADDLKKYLAKLATMAEDKLDTALGAILFRQDCPDRMILGDYGLGLLATAEAAEIGQHLAGCPYCPAELARLTESLVPPERATAEPGWVEQVVGFGRVWLEPESGRWRQIAVALTNLGRPPQAPAALPGMMGQPAGLAASGPEQLSLAPPGADFELEISFGPDQSSGEPDHCRLAVMLTLLDRFGDFSGIDVILHWGEQTRREVTNALGQVTFAALPCAQLNQMNLMVTLPD
jgi:hypothetical protein